ncbi:MAG: discoidin domain-containing protein [Planctomycetota bacterium]
MRIFRTKHKSNASYCNKGSVLLFTLMVMIGLTSVVGAYLGFVRYSTKSTGAQITDSQAVYLAEAGLQKAIWNLMRTAANGGQGENWTTAGTTENLGEGGYTMVVERWDWALAANDATVSSDDSAVGQPATNANDGDDVTYWESDAKPQGPRPKSLTIAFPYALTINKVRFLAPTSDNRPRDYKWQVSTDGSIYADAFDEVSGNGSADVTDTFPEQSNVTHMRLIVTKAGQPSSTVMVSTVEAIGSKITVTGTVGGNSRVIEETVAVDDASEEAYDQIDWKEND